jgi:hypothetical protein
MPQLLLTNIESRAAPLSQPKTNPMKYLELLLLYLGGLAMILIFVGILCELYEFISTFILTH